MRWVDVALVVLAVAFGLGLVRAIRGPGVADRAVAADLCFYAITAGIALLALRTGSDTFYDVVLIATLLGFLASIALGGLISRRKP